VQDEAAACHARSSARPWPATEVSPPSEPGVQGQTTVDDPTTAAGARLSGAEPASEPSVLATLLAIADGGQ
jgi:hypothetical protein